MSSALEGMLVQRDLNPDFAKQKNGLRWDEGQVRDGLKSGVSGEQKWADEATIWPAPPYPTNREFKGEVINHAYGRFIIK